MTLLLITPEALDETTCSLGLVSSSASRMLKMKWSDFYKASRGLQALGAGLAKDAGLGCCYYSVGLRLRQEFSRVQR